MEGENAGSEGWGVVVTGRQNPFRVERNRVIAVALLPIYRAIIYKGELIRNTRYLLRDIQR
jgi:hypothetical protein